MDEQIKTLLHHAEDHMKKSIAHLEIEFGKIRAGKAHPSMIDSVTVDYYGSPTPIAQVASVTIADARTLSVQPWEKHMIPVIGRAIRDANLGLNPIEDSNIVRVPIPPLNEERRKTLVKQAKGDVEEAKVAIRNIRQDVNHKLKQFQKDGKPEDMVKAAEADVQKLTDKFIAKVDEVFKIKEGEIMTV